jgi:hypothetical protein
MKYDKQDQQGKAAFNERNPHMTQQQELVARSRNEIVQYLGCKVENQWINSKLPVLTSGDKMKLLNKFIILK